MNKKVHVLIELKITRCTIFGLLKRAVSVLLLLLLGMGMVGNAFGEDKRYFNIPHGNAQVTLKTYAEQAGRQVLYPYSVVEAYKTNAVQGRYTLDNALKLLLNNTGLNAISSQDGRLTIQVITKNKELGESHMKKQFTLKSLVLAILGAGTANAVIAQEQAPSTRSYGLEEIVVTAQKREQSINDVPMSITAATADQLEMAGVKGVEDLAKITPGLSFGKSNINTPVFTIRGVGYNDVAIAARPAVTVYLDEALIPFGNETAGVGFDVERVEVLKGPQGTLFGNNSTGGAINYVAAKPTEEFEAGVTASYGRFDQLDLEGYISGPLTDTLSARLAIQNRSMDDWQESYTRNDSRGEVDFTNARLSFLWEPTEDLRSQLTFSYWADKSEMPGTQVIDISPQIPPFVPLTQVGDLTLTPLGSGRDTDWNPGESFEKDNNFFQSTLRIDYNLSDTLVLTSLTSYIDYEQDQTFDSDGTFIESVHNPQIGDSESYSQELRIAGTYDRMNTVFGVYYAHDETNDDLPSLIAEGTVAYAFTGLGAPVWTSLVGRANQESDTYAVFGNIEYELTDRLTGQAGIRYTDVQLDALNCSADLGDGNAAAVFNTFLNTALRGPAGLPPIAAPAPGECVSILTPQFDHIPVIDSLNEDNVSWRLGLQYDLSDDTLLYASIAEGYKGGAFSSFGTTFSNSYIPATQESVLSYEIGFKSSLLDQTVQLNGAVFYSDYEDKQVLGNVVDPNLGTIARLVNIPSSTIYGGELQLVAAPADGLTIMIAGSYIQSQIEDHYTDFNALQVLQDMDGTMLPYVPEKHLTASVRYEWPLNDNLNAFVGANTTYKSESYSYLGEVDLVKVDGYATTDMQAGVESADGRWRAYAWGRNVFDKYYWHSAARLLDTTVRFPGMPATYGVTLSYNFR